MIVVDTCPVSYGRTNVWYYDTKNPDKKFETKDKITLKLTDLKGFWHTMIEIFEKIFDHIRK